jgi:phytanoyl-CoA dioxygenase PhyH
MGDLHPSTVEDFRTHGWICVPAAFSADDAAAMCDVIWERGLAQMGILRNDSSTWTKDRPEHLQHLKSDPAFRAIGSARTMGAIKDVLEGREWQRPTDWGAFFLQFPTRREWNVPASGWHLDGDYTGSLLPPCGVKVHAMLTDVGPRCGGMNILSGSHRLVHKWFRENAPLPGAKGAQLRKSLQRHPYLRDLCTEGDPGERIARFHDRVQEVDGIPLKVIENTASAGDVILMHSLLLHAPPAAHTGREPRFLLNKDIDMRYFTGALG